MSKSDMCGSQGGHNEQYWSLECSAMQFCINVTFQIKPTASGNPEDECSMFHRSISKRLLDHCL
jgi:hypothetical protein